MQAVSGIETIMVVDDSRSIRKLLSGEFEACGLKVTEAADGREALEILATETPDAIICDVNMPEVDGWEVCWKVRLDPGLRHVPFFFLTARGEVNDRHRGVEMGADDYITKPCRARDILERIQNMMENTDLLARREVQTPPPAGHFGKNGTGISSIIQAFCLTNQSGELRIRNEATAPGEFVRLEIRNGNVVTARSGENTGSEALRELLSAARGDYVFQEGAITSQTEFEDCTLRLIAQLG